MKRPSFIQGVVLALVLALSGTAAFTALMFVLSPSVLLKSLIAILAGLYVVYVLAASREQTGRLAIAVLWLFCAFAAWLLAPGLVSFLIAHLTIVWLIRSLYFHTSVLPALLDLALCGIGALAAIATLRHTHSTFFAIWSFFLVQALFTAIPSLIEPRVPAPADDPEQGFNRALRSAEAALRRMHTPN